MILISYFLSLFFLQMFDRAVTDRVDEVVEFDLPDKSERCALLELYFKQYVVSCENVVFSKHACNFSYKTPLFVGFPPHALSLLFCTTRHRLRARFASTSL